MICKETRKTKFPWKRSNKVFILMVEKVISRKFVEQSLNLYQFLSIAFMFMQYKYCAVYQKYRETISRKISNLFFKIRFSESSRNFSKIKHNCKWKLSSRKFFLTHELSINPKIPNFLVEEREGRVEDIRFFSAEKYYKFVPRNSILSPRLRFGPITKGLKSLEKMANKGLARDFVTIFSFNLAAAALTSKNGVQYGA